MVYNSNPMVVVPRAGQGGRAAWPARTCSRWSATTFLTDTARYADIVLPATTQLEQLDIMFSWGHFYVSLNTPAIEPLGEAVSNTELFRRLAARMGFDRGVLHAAPTRRWWPRRSTGRPPRCRASPSSRCGRRAGRGSTCLPPTSTPRTPRATSRRRRARPSSARRSPTTSSCRCSGRARTTTSPATRSTPSRTTSRRGRPPTAATGSTCSRPSRTPTSTPARATRPRRSGCRASRPSRSTRADAAERGITDGRYVRVFNDRGQFVALAKVSDEVAPGVAMCPLGAWPKNAKDSSTVNAVNPFRVRRPRQRADVLRHPRGDRGRLSSCK